MKSSIIIGRSSHCDIIVTDDSISREHARISIINGQYVYEDLGRNGSVIGNHCIHGSRLAIAPGTEVLLAGKIPLPWNKIYSLLPLHGSNPYESPTKHQQEPIYNYQSNFDTQSKDDDRLGVGYSIISFLIPLVGWIIYFAMKEDNHKKAIQASNLAWIGVLVNLLLTFMFI